MITATVAPNEVSIVEALWTLINPLKQSAKELLALRLNESLLAKTRQDVKAEEIELSEAMEYVKTLSAQGKIAVPNDENGISAFIDEK